MSDYNIVSSNIRLRNNMNVNIKIIMKKKTVLVGWLPKMEAYY